MERILVIEDNPEIRENITELLELSNYKTFSAENGKEGLKKAIQCRPDLILCDIMMPVLDGYGVLHVVQKNATLQNIPFIFLTAKSERPDFRKGMEMGADDFLTKPIETTDLLAAIERKLRKTAQLKHAFQQSQTDFYNPIGSATNENCFIKLKENKSVNLYKRKQIIYSEGNQPAYLYYIVRGRVKTFLKNEDGKELITNLYKEDDFLGYPALLENAVYKESAESLEDCQLALIPRIEFEAMLIGNPAAMKSFIAIMASNVNEKEEKLLAIAYNSVRKKVADTLIAFHNKYNPASLEHFSIEVSRENLAAMAGVAKESLIRTLSDFKNERLIKITTRQIQIMDFPKLKKVCN